MKKEINKIDEVEVYRSYVKAIGTKGYSVTKLCKKLGIPRPTLYAIVKRVENGDEIQLQRCLNKSRYDCLWEYRYKRRFVLLQDDNNIGQLKTLIKDMRKDGFGLRDISRRINKDVSTVSWHINH